MAAAEAWKAISHDDVEVSSSWTLWIQNRRCGDKLGAKQLSRLPVKLWRGLRTRKARADQCPANDSVRRRSAAKDALHVALSWESSGRLASEWCQLDPSTRDAWFSLQIARIATAGARTIQSAMRTWKHWCAWCCEQKDDYLRPSTPAPVAFLYAASTTTKTQGQVPRTLPTTRFNHLRWIEANLGSLVLLRDSDRPTRHATDGAFATEQHVASDAEVHMHLDRVFSQLAYAGPARIVIVIIQLLWMSVLRFQHMQRSVPVRLTTEFLYGICWKGKGKPAYRWACPRYGPTGADVCGCMWSRWQELAKGCADAFGLLYGNGVPFSLAGFHAANRSILKEHLCMQDTDIFTSYSLRRSMPTLAEMNGTHPGDADALGDWTFCQG